MFRHFQQNVLTALRIVGKGQSKKAGDQLGGYCNNVGRRPCGLGGHSHLQGMREGWICAQVEGCAKGLAEEADGGD